MEAPVLPPAPDTVPALVANATELSNKELSAHLTTNASVSASASKPSGWLPSFQLAHSFNFLSQAFSSAKSSSLLNFSLEGGQYSATAPLQWSLSNSWQNWMTTADIQVVPVQAADLVAQAENKVWDDLYAEQCLLSGDRENTSDRTETPAYRITLRDQTLGYVADQEHAQLLAQHLRRLVRQAAFDAETVAPQMIPSDLADSAADEPLANELNVTANGYPLFSIDESMAEAIGYSKEWAAVAWANNLRVALEAEPLSVGAAHSGLKNLAASDIAL